MNTQAEKTTENKDDLEVELEGDDFEIEVEDDTPEEDRGRSRKAATAEPEPEGAEEDDLENYSDSVKKRIKKLTYERHEERRRREEAERFRDEATRFAEKSYKENEDLRKRLTQGETVALTQAKSRVESELGQAKAAFKQAYEAGDSDAMLEAQSKLTELNNEMYRLSNWKPAPAQQSNPAPSQQAADPPSKQPPAPPQKALDWAEKNPWFNTDSEMTGYAFGVHERLVKNGVDPNSETYYNEIDTAMKKRFPEKFEAAEEEVKTQPRQTSSVVAPAGRTSKNPRKVVLTTTQVNLAKRLGLTPQQYAAQLMKDKTNG